MNQEKIKKGIELLLEGIGENIEREGLKDTPTRVGRMYEELCGGHEKDPADEITAFFKVENDDMVIVKDIQFHSLCEHHLLPFFGQAHIAYIPKDGKVTGLSKLARVVEVASKRLSLQERLTNEIIKALDKKLEAKGIFVILEAEHMCMTLRGIKKPGAKTITYGMKGEFKVDKEKKNEVLSLIRTGR